MTTLRNLLIVTALIASPLPALAGGIAFDLPRLDFPAPSGEATRGCNEAVLTVCGPTR